MVLGRDLLGIFPRPTLKCKSSGAIGFLECADMPVDAHKPVPCPSVLCRLDCFFIRQRTAYEASTHGHYNSNTLPLFSAYQLMELAREPHVTGRCHAFRIASTDNYNALLGRKRARIVRAAKV